MNYAIFLAIEPFFTRANKPLNRVKLTSLPMEKNSVQRVRFTHNPVPSLLTSLYFRRSTVSAKWVFWLSSRIAFAFKIFPTNDILMKGSYTSLKRTPIFQSKTRSEWDWRGYVFRSYRSLHVSPQCYVPTNARQLIKRAYECQILFIKLYTIFLFPGGSLHFPLDVYVTIIIFKKFFPLEMTRVSCCSSSIV